MRRVDHHELKGAAPTAADSIVAIRIAFQTTATRSATRNIALLITSTSLRTTDRSLLLKESINRINNANEDLMHAACFSFFMIS